MLSLARGLRRSSWALLLSILLGAVVWPSAPAFADDDEEEEEEEEEEGDDEGDDEGGGDDEGDGEDEDEEADKDQPPVTAGGLFTLRTYPIRELFRPLTMTQGVTQIRAGLGVDVSDKTAFEYFGIGLDVRHGYKDNFTLIGGFSGDYNFKAFSVSGGFEGALAYDLVDIRLAARINRAAVPDMFDPTTGKPTAYRAGAGTKFSIDLGFPFRYVATPEIAIVALETLISFDFNSTARGNGGDGLSCFAATDTPGFDPNNCTENGSKPDLNPSLGISTNPIAALSVVLYGQLQIRDFDTTNAFSVPATARVQFSPNQKLDIGLEFKFLDMKPKDPDGEGPLEAPAFYDNRFLNLFMAYRLGR